MLKVAILLCLIVSSWAVEVNEHIVRNGNDHSEVDSSTAPRVTETRAGRQFGFSGSGAQAGASSFGGGFGGGGFPGGYGGGFSGSQANAGAGSFGGGFGR